MAFFKSLKRVFSKVKPKARQNKQSKTESTAKISVADHLDSDLITAARQGFIPDVQRLPTHSAANALIYHEQPYLRAFFAAARSNQADVVVMLIKEYQAPPDVENSNGKTALQLAVEAGHGKATRVPIENGADPFRGVEWYREQALDEAGT